MLKLVAKNEMSQRQVIIRWASPGLFNSCGIVKWRSLILHSDPLAHAIGWSRQPHTIKSNAYSGCIIHSSISRSSATMSASSAVLSRLLLLLWGIAAADACWPVPDEYGAYMLIPSLPYDEQKEARFRDCCAASPPHPSCAPRSLFLPPPVQIL